MLLLSLALLAQSADDIVVRARRERAERLAARQAEAVLPPLPFQEPYPRFEGAVCPGVSGLAPASAQAVADRIGIVADSVGLKVGEPGCDANLLVLVVDDGAATVRHIYPRTNAVFATKTIAEIRRIIAEPGRARGWTVTAMVTQDGEPVPVDPWGGTELPVRRPSQITTPFRREIVSAVVVIDAAAARGRDIGQIADYAAMRGLTDGRATPVPGTDTVMSAFTPEGDATAPKALTAFDRGLLAGLYTGQAYFPSFMKRARIADSIVSTKP